MKHKKLYIIGLIILLIIDLGLAYQSYQGAKSPNYDVFEVKSGQIIQTVSATGDVQTSSQIDLQFIGSGKITAVNIKVGDLVRAGQVLAAQDSSDLVWQEKNAQAALQIAQAKLAQVLDGASVEDVAIAQTAVVNAQQNLDDTKKSLIDAESSATNSLSNVLVTGRRTSEASLLIAHSALDSNSVILDSSELNQNNFSGLNLGALSDARSLKISASSDYNKASVAISGLTNLNEQSFDNAVKYLEIALGTISKALDKTFEALSATVSNSDLTSAELDAYKADILTSHTSVNTAYTNVVTSFQNLSTQKITNQTNLNTAQAKVAASQGALDAAKNQLALKIAKPRQTDIDLYQAQVAQAQANLSQIRNQISQKNILAPIDGIITKIPYEKGETVSASQIIVSMNSFSDFEIKSDIPETDIAKISLGDQVVIDFDAFGEKEKWSGIIMKINPSETEVQGVVYYQITVGLPSKDDRIKPGMTANLEIETERQENVLIAPSRAISETNGKKNVKILNGVSVEEKIIETGIKNDQGEVEIKSGLKVGDKIVIENTK